MQLHPIIQEDVTSILKNTRAAISKLSGKKVLITGAGGMLASYLVYTLIEANAGLYASSKKPITLYLVIRNGRKPFGKNPHVHYVNIDIAKKKLRLKSVNYIIHAASSAAPKYYTAHRTDTLDTNIRGTYHLLDIVDKNLKSFLFFSSGAVYGEQTPPNIDESYIGSIDHLAPKASYTVGKLTAETILMNNFHEKKLPVKIARIFHTFGPGLNLHDGRIFSDFIKSALTSSKIIIKGNPTLSRPFLYIKDASIMLLKLLTSEKNGRVYNIANSSQTMSVQDFANCVAQATTQIRGQPVRVVRKKDDTINYFKKAAHTYNPSIHAFVHDFHYRPSVSVNEAVRRTIQTVL